MSDQQPASVADEQESPSTEASQPAPSPAEPEVPVVETKLAGQTSVRAGAELSPTPAVQSAWRGPQAVNLVVAGLSLLTAFAALMTARDNASTAAQMRRYFEAEKRVNLQPYLVLQQGEAIDGGFATLEVMNRGRGNISWVEVRTSVSQFSSERRQFVLGEIVSAHARATVFDRLEPFESKRVSLLPSLEYAADYCERMKGSEHACSVFVFAAAVGRHPTTGEEVRATEVFALTGSNLQASAFVGVLLSDGGLQLSEPWLSAVPMMQRWSELISNVNDNRIYPSEPFSGLGLEEAGRRVVRVHTTYPSDAGATDGGALAPAKQRDD